MRRLFRLIVCLAAIAAGCAAAADEARTYVVAVRRGGAIEFIDPVTLETAGRIRFNLPENSGGFNGVFASPDGSTLYVEGPIKIPDVALAGCCGLYSIDLATLETKRVAGIWGVESRGAFFVSNGIAHPTPVAMADVLRRGSPGEQWYFSPDEKWLFGLKRGPAVDVYDWPAKSFVRQLTAAGLSGDPGQRWQTGAWSGDRFYLYATERDGAGRIWTISPETTELAAAVAVPRFGPDCSNIDLTGFTAAGRHLFVYEVFGSKLDPRDYCGNGMPGGAWVVNPATGELSDHIRPDLHFWTLIPNADGSELYGLSYGSVPMFLSPVTLVRIDAQSLRTLRERLLDTDYWWIITARLRDAPIGDVWAFLPKQ